MLDLPSAEMEKRVIRDRSLMSTIATAPASQTPSKPTLPIHSDHRSVGIVHTHRRDLAQAHILRLYVTLQPDTDVDALKVGLQVLVNLQLTLSHQTYIADVEGAEGEQVLGNRDLVVSPVHAC